MAEQTVIPGRFDGKVAIVTGGSFGIGFAIAERLGREGAKVAIVGKEDAPERAVLLEEQGIEVLNLVGNIADESFCEEIVAATLDRFGRVDLLVNNAFSFLAKSLDATREDWHMSFDVGPFAFAKMIQMVTEPMKKVGGGAIVNISSISGAIAQVNRWTYNVGKGAVNQLTKCAALDLAPHGIRVNSISPGWIWTREVDKAAGGDREKFDPIWGEYHMLGRCGLPEECAGPVLFLLSDDASFITGTDVPVDGGYQSMGPEGLGRTAIIAGSE